MDKAPVNACFLFLLVSRRTFWQHLSPGSAVHCLPAYSLPTRYPASGHAWPRHQRPARLSSPSSQQALAILGSTAAATATAPVTQTDSSSALPPATGRRLHSRLTHLRAPCYTLHHTRQRPDPPWRPYYSPSLTFKHPHHEPLRHRRGSRPGPGPRRRPPGMGEYGSRACPHRARPRNGLHGPAYPLPREVRRVRTREAQRHDLGKGAAHVGARVE